VTVSVKEQILGLQVAVDDVVGVEVIEGKCDLCSVELCDWVREALSLVSSWIAECEICQTRYIPGTCAED